MRSSLITIILSLIFALTAGCTDATTTPTTGTAEGLWNGNTSTSRTLTIAVLDDGTMYAFYSAVANPAVIAGVIQGNGTSNNGTFMASNVKDFGIGVTALEATVSANFGARQFFNGSINYQAGGTVSFNTSYNTAYDTTPAIVSFTGVYQGQVGSSVGAQPATITMASDGTFTGSEQSGCTFTGKATVRTRGNVLDQSITFGGSPCFFAGSTFQGVVYLDLLTRRLFAAAPNTSRTDAVIFFGTKII